MEINSRLRFFLLFGKGGAAAAKLGGVLMSAKSDEDVCRKLGQEGAAIFVKKRE